MKCYHACVRRSSRQKVWLHSNRSVSHGGDETKLYATKLKKKGKWKIKELNLAPSCRFCSEMRQQVVPGGEIGDDTFLNLDKMSSTLPKQLCCFHCRLHRCCSFVVNWRDTGRFQLGLILSCIRVVAIYTSTPLTAERSWVAYVTDITEKAPCRQAQEAVGSSQAASSWTRLRLYGAQSQLLNPMEAIKPFIFYV